MSGAALIKRFGQTITIRRDTNAEQRIKGKRVADTWKEFTIIASVQPFEPDETIEESPGAERNRHGIRIYSNEELKSIDIKGQFKGDQIIFDGETFEVTRVSKWQRNKRNLTHYKSIAWLINEEKDK